MISQLQQQRRIQSLPSFGYAGVAVKAKRKELLALLRRGLRWLPCHTFRRTYTTLLHANGEDVKVVQELLRHGSAKITMDVYAQAVTPAKRKAQEKVGDVARHKRKTNRRAKIVCLRCVPAEKQGSMKVQQVILRAMAKKIT